MTSFSVAVTDPRGGEGRVRGYANLVKIRPGLCLMKADDANVHLISHVRSEKETGSS